MSDERTADAVLADRSCSAATASQPCSVVDIVRRRSASVRHSSDNWRQRRRRDSCTSALLAADCQPRSGLVAPASAFAGENSNLLRMRHLGHSEPTLRTSINAASGGVSVGGAGDRLCCDAGLMSPSILRRRATRSLYEAADRRQRPLSLPLAPINLKREPGWGKVHRSSHQRRSMVGVTSPMLFRCQSPLTASPVASPKNCHSTGHNFSYIMAKRTAEARRWSLASLPSSGYGTTPGSSSVSSQCSSQERLHSLSTTVNNCSLTTPLARPPRHHPLHHPQNQQQLESSPHCHYSSNESNPSLDEETGHVRSPHVRPRSRSLSSPVRVPLADNDIILMNTMYKERFPTATTQMEQRLQSMVDEYDNEETVLDDASPSAVAIIGFVRHQLMELIRDCLKKSRDKLVSVGYFYDMSENIDKLFRETMEKSVEAATHVSSLLRRFLLAIGRPARLLECLQFDPDQFYELMSQAEQQAVQCDGVCVGDAPQYVLNKLGLKRDPLTDLLAADIGELRPCDVSCSRDSTLVSSTPKKHCQSVDNTASSSGSIPCETDYDVVKLISNGAYGAVYMVRHRQTALRYAMKRINKQNVVLRNQAEQVFIERDIMSFSDNPFVVSFHCSFETKRHLCLVMEYVEGGDCATLLKNIGTLPADLARLYFAETVLAVEYLHSFGVVHRDLKPDNLLITAVGHIKLTDFGLSKMGLMSLATNLYEGYIDRETKQFSDKQVFGTPEYIAPEVILCRGYGKPVDWWSMGVILYEFLVGCVPFFGDTPEELFSHTVNDDIDWPEEEDFQVTSEARSLIVQLLAQNPLERLGTEGAHEVKEHEFFSDLDWHNLLREKVDFLPQLDGQEDTSYFDTRADRYSHDLEGDTDDTEESLTFSSFSSCSPRLKKLQPRSHLKRCMSHGDSGGHSDHSESSVSAHSSSCHDSSLTRSASTSRAALPDIGPTLTTPDSSQTESDDISPQLQRRRRSQRDMAHSTPPRLSVSLEDGTSLTPSLAVCDHTRDLSPVEELDKSPPRAAHKLTPDFNISSSAAATTSTVGAGADSRSSTSPCFSLRKFSKSTSASGLNLVIPSVEQLNQGEALTHSAGGSSSASSRDASPCRELSPLLCSLRPPITLRRGAAGYGFTMRAIRVYLGDSDYFSVHHLVMGVEAGGSAFEAGLQPGDLITHINGESVQGLLHTQVLQLLLSGGSSVSVRVAPLNQTSISTGGRRRPPGASRLARRAAAGHSRRRRRDAAASSSTAGASDRARHKPPSSSLLRKISTKRASAELHQQRQQQQQQRVSAADVGCVSAGCAESACCCVAAGAAAVGSSSAAALSQSRPSSLHGLKNKLHAAAKSAHTGCRRKSVATIPLSPLARTPSPGPLPAVSPTRSPSPLAVSTHPAAGSAGTAAAGTGGASSAQCPASPLLRRTMSPDRVLRPAVTCDGRLAPSPLVSGRATAPRVTVTASDCAPASPRAGRSASSISSSASTHTTH